MHNYHHNYTEQYVDINGAKQYQLHYPGQSDIVILHIHGGPGQTEAQFAYYFNDERLNCNVVYYDQRGSGKTQLKNKTRPDAINLDILLEDLRETIVYLKKKYITEKIILVGHSWGSILGTSYIRKYPADVLCYVGTGQVVDMMKNEMVGFEKLGEMIRARGKQKDIEIYAKFVGYPYSIRREKLIKTILSVRKLQGKYGLMGDPKKTQKVFLKSPIFRLSDIYPILTGLRTNKSLLDLMLSYSVVDSVDYQVPVFYICGRYDWQTPSVLVEEYFNKVQAPSKGLFWVENAGHFAQFDNPQGFSDALLQVIRSLQ